MLESEDAVTILLRTVCELRGQVESLRERAGRKFDRWARKLVGFVGLFVICLCCRLQMAKAGSLLMAQYSVAECAESGTVGLQF